MESMGHGEDGSEDGSGFGGRVRLWIFGFTCRSIAMLKLLTVSN